MNKSFFIFLIMTFSLVFVTGELYEDCNIYGNCQDLTSTESTNFSTIEVNASEIWITNEGDLDEVNSTLFSNNGGTLDIVEESLTAGFWNTFEAGPISRLSQIEHFYLTNLGFNEGEHFIDGHIRWYQQDAWDLLNVNASYFNGGIFTGVFNWFSLDTWNIFNGTHLQFNETKLNDTIDLKIASVPSGNPFDQSLNTTDHVKFDTMNATTTNATTTKTTDIVLKGEIQDDDTSSTISLEDGVWIVRG